MEGHVFLQDNFGSAFDEGPFALHLSAAVSWAVKDGMTVTLVCDEAMHLFGNITSACASYHQLNGQVFCIAANLHELPELIGAVTKYDRPRYASAVACHFSTDLNVYDFAFLDFAMGWPGDGCVELGPLQHQSG